MVRKIKPLKKTSSRSNYSSNRKKSYTQPTIANAKADYEVINSPYACLEWMNYLKINSFPENSETIKLSADNIAKITENVQILKLLKYAFADNITPNRYDDEYQKILILYEENKYTLVDINQLMLESGSANYTKNIQCRLRNGEKVFCKVPLCYVVRNFLPEENRQKLEPYKFNFSIQATTTKFTQTEFLSDIESNLEIIDKIYTENNITIKIGTTNSSYTRSSNDFLSLKNSLFSPKSSSSKSFLTLVCSNMSLSYIKESDDPTQYATCMKLVKAVRCLHSKHVILQGTLEKGFYKAVNSSTVVGREYMQDLVWEIMCAIPLSLLNIVNTYMHFVFNATKWVDYTQRWYLDDIYNNHHSAANVAIHDITRNYNDICHLLTGIESENKLSLLNLSPTEVLFIKATCILKNKLIAFELPLLENARTMLANYTPMSQHAYADVINKFKEKNVCQKQLYGEILDHWEKYAAFIGEEVGNNDSSLMDKKRRDIRLYCNNAIKLRRFLYCETLKDTTELPLMEWLMYLRLFSLFKNQKYTLDNVKNLRTDINKLSKLLTLSDYELRKFPLHVSLWRNILFSAFLYINPGMERTVALSFDTRCRLAKWRKRRIENWDWNSVFILTHAGHTAYMSIPPNISTASNYTKSTI